MAQPAAGTDIPASSVERHEAASLAVPPRTTIFVSYSRNDRKWLDRLQIHLKPFSRGGQLEVWDDTKLDAGEQWRVAIRAAIERAAAAILLISADFLASDFIASDELPPLLHKAQNDGTRIIPIVVQPCRLRNHPQLAAFHAINPPTQPLSKLSESDAEDVFVQATEQVEKVLAANIAASAGADSTRRARAAADAVFADLEAAAIVLAILVALAGRAEHTSGRTLTELERDLQIGSRKLAYQGVTRLLAAGWIARTPRSKRAEYVITADGVRHLQRLAAAADGPIRQAVARR